VESGVRTDDAEAVKRMKEKRLRKLNTINELSQRYERVMVYGSGKPIVFAYGSTALELREAMKYIDFTLVVPIYLEPFPYEELQPYQDSEAIVVEHSIMPNFAKFLSSKMALKVKANILRYDGRQFSAEELVKAIREADNA
jgi:2-oxoglutarate ferredoxin oxidoreductase subunit alpha